MIANVMLTDAAHALDRTFDYKIPTELEPCAAVGMRVLVPFGVHNAAAEGVIIALSETSSYPRLKSVLRCPDQTPLCSEEQLELITWMQRRYLCSFQQAHRMVRPPYMGGKIRQWVTFLQEPEDELLTPSQVQFLNTLKECGNAAELSEIEALLHKRSLKSVAYALKERGGIAITDQLDPAYTLKYIRKAHLTCDAEEGYALSDALRARRAPVQADLILTLCEYGDLKTSDLIMMADGNYASLQALCDKGIVSIYRERIERSVYTQDAVSISAPYTPTEEQKPVIDHLCRCITHNFHEKILLRGVTGSGKTEVFLQAIRECIACGKQAIMLVPEISLTPQMVSRFVSRFGTDVAVIHSGLSQAERFEQWHKIKDGEVSVVVGARSAVFAPFQNIGIIILDEEHETSYQSETAPRYHAREVAFFRGQKMGAPVLLASATPSVDSFYRAQTGKYKLFEMHRRYNENALPKTRIVDMRSELLDYHNTSAISIRLREEIRRNLDQKEKTILFLNRRGYHTFVSCRECGYVAQCKECSIALTYHRHTDQLVCHYCGYTQKNLTVCPECGSKYIKFFGTGTQKIEEELHTLFPDARILRMDFDTTSAKGGHESILNRFKNNEADILLGTQMVTKGLDFPDVTLVGVLAADSALNVEDYRAGERCFSLITQVCGRAGRGEIEGRAVIQTYQPQNIIIQLAKQQDYPKFYENEIRYRKQMQYPPFCDFIYFLLSGDQEADVKAEIESISAFIKQASLPILKTIGPAPAPIAKIKNKFRYRLLLKAEHAEDFLPLLHEINRGHRESRMKNRLIIDINPVSMI